MKAVIQRVVSASVVVDDKTVAIIGLGLCVFIGIHRNDTQKDIDYIARKIVNIRVFDGDNGKLSVKEKGYEVLCRSQITLCSHIQGFKVNYYQAMAPKSSKQLYNTFLSTIRREYCVDRIKDGMFKVLSQVYISNDGPLTIILDSREKDWDHNVRRSIEAKKHNISL